MNFSRKYKSWEGKYSNFNEKYIFYDNLHEYIFQLALTIRAVPLKLCSWLNLMNFKTHH